MASDEKMTSSNGHSIFSNLIRTVGVLTQIGILVVLAMILIQMKYWQNNTLSVAMDTPYGSSGYPMHIFMQNGYAPDSPIYMKAVSTSG